MPDIRKFILSDKRELDIVSKVDTTLTQENIPGDAKTIGDRLNELDTKISNISTQPSDTDKEVVNADTHYDFPSIGSVDVIYKAYNERMMYQWNAEKLAYEPLNETNLDINLINGGNANGD